MSNANDSFNRSDGAVGTADSGHVWSNLSGVGAIISNQFYFSTKAGHDVSVVETNESDGTVQAVLAAGGSDCGLVFRAVDNQNYMLAKVLGSSNLFILYKNTTASGFEFVTLGAYSPVATDLVSVDFNADAIVGKVNGSTIFSATNSTHQTATKHGLRIFTDDSSTRWDGFAFTGVGAAAALARRYMYQQAVNRAGTY